MQSLFAQLRYASPFSVQNSQHLRITNLLFPIAVPSGSINLFNAGQNHDAIKLSKCDPYLEAYFSG